PPTARGSGAQLNDQGFALMRQGRYAEALPLFEQALEELRGSGTLPEAYTLYNLAFTRLQLGDCTDVRRMLDRSQRIQGRRAEIDRARVQANSQCGGDNSGPGGGGDD
ncbi:MAG: tetratricopeptide repeat protein, partial [Thermoleophilia bacterium]|nr:tetratricopeptide repeat protein [Thermoleophilia bacterium]